MTSSLSTAVLTCSACCLQDGHIGEPSFAMDAIIRQTVREEMRRSASLVPERVASLEVESSDSAATGQSRSFSNSEPPNGATESYKESRKQQLK